MTQWRRLLVSIGDPAPAFDLPAAPSGKAKLADYKGKWLVLYFYPKDDTSGCTKQAIAFTEHHKDFEKAGAKVLGVSKDSIARHERFREKHELGIDLASDEDGQMLEAYGVWVEKKMYGRTFMGIERSTLLIDPKGKVHEIWRKVKVAGHIEAVLAALNEAT